MIGLQGERLAFILTALSMQTVLVFHFALRKWCFPLAMQYGWVVYALSVPALIVSTVLLVKGGHWALWLGGFIYLVWAVLGYTADYTLAIQWRSPIYWPVFGPYVTLYLATVMFYWWPLGLISRPLWYTGAVLFLVSTVLNLTSHSF